MVTEFEFLNSTATFFSGLEVRDVGSQGFKDNFGVGVRDRGYMH